MACSVAIPAAAKGDTFNAEIHRWLDQFYVGTGSQINFNPFASSGQAQDLANAADGTFGCHRRTHLQRRNHWPGRDIAGLKAATLVLALTRPRKWSTGCDRRFGRCTIWTLIVSDLMVDLLVLDHPTQRSSKNGAPFHGQTPLAGVVSIAGRPVLEPA